MLPSYVPVRSPRRATPIVLVIEDNPRDHEFLEEVWKDSGFTIRFLGAETSQKAFQLLCATDPSELPDLIVIEINFPSMTGHDILRTLQGDAIWSSIPMVVWTSSAAATDRLRSLAWGATEHVVKPRNYEGYRALVPILTGLSHRSRTSGRMFGRDDSGLPVYDQSMSGPTSEPT